MPPQRPAYTPSPTESAAAYNPGAEAPARPFYPSYSAPMMQSPYISGTARASTPVLSTSREGAAQYTAVSTNVYSPQAKAAVVASENANKKKKAGKVFMTITAFLLLAAMTGMLYISGVFKQNDNSIYIPDASGDSQTSVTQPDKTEPVLSSTDSNNSATDNDSTDTVPDEPQIEEPVDKIPGNLSRTTFADANAFISSFIEVGLSNINGSISSDALVEFAVAGLSLNSSVFSYDSEGFSIGDTTYNYSISEALVGQRIARYFGESIQIFPATGDSGDGWLYYGSSYYFTDIAQPKGFAVITDYSESGDVIDVKFNVYSPTENDAKFYSMTAKETEEDGCTLIATGAATFGKTNYNGRDTYIISSIQTIAK